MIRDGERTSLELARTPALDRLAREGELMRLRTVAPGLAAGSEAAIPALLGWTPTAPVDRGAPEAAADDIAVGPSERAWRVDVAGRPAAAVARAAVRLDAAAPAHDVHVLRGHRPVVVGPPPLPPLAVSSAPPPAPGGGVCRVCSSIGAQLDTPPGLEAWPEGIVPPRLLDACSILARARGAAIGAARLLGAATVNPAGATGALGSDLAAKASAALRAIEAGGVRGAGEQQHARVVVHAGGADEAAHNRDRGAKIACSEFAVAPLAAVVAHVGGTVVVCPDHGCDPRTGMDDAAPVACAAWSPARDRPADASQRRLTERALRHLPVADLPTAKLAA